MAKVLNSSKLLSRIPDRPTDCKNSLRAMRISLDLHELSTIRHESKYLSIRGIRGLCGIGVLAVFWQAEVY